MFLAPELQCERNSCDQLGFCASGLVFQDMGEALSHLCFCYNFPLLSTQKLSLGSWEALKANSPHSIIIWRKNMFEKKGLLEFKHHLPSSTSPLRCLLLCNPLRGLYWAVQSTNCLREAPAWWTVFLRRGSHRPFWGLLLIFKEPDSVLSQLQTPALTRCSSRTAHSAAFLIVLSGMKRLHLFHRLYFLRRTVHWCHPHLTLYFVIF